MVYHVRQWLDSAISTLSLDAVFLSKSASEGIRRELGHRYGANTPRGIHSDALRACSAVQHPESSRWVGELVDLQSAVYLFCDEHQLYEVLRLARGHDVIGLLEETPGFPFYLSDPEHRYLIAHNDHDHLIGAGAAREWVASLDPRHHAWVASLPPRDP